MVSVWNCRFVIDSSFCSVTFVGCAGFVNVLGNARSVYSDSDDAQFRRALRHFLGRALKLYIGDQDDLVWCGSEEVFRGYANCASALALAAKRAPSAVAGRHIVSFFHFRGRVVYVHCLNDFCCLLRDNVLCAGDGVIVRDIVGRGDFLVCVAGREAWAISKCVFRVLTIGRRYALQCVIVAQCRIRWDELSKAKLTRRYGHFSFEGDRVSVIRSQAPFCVTRACVFGLWLVYRDIR